MTRGAPTEGSDAPDCYVWRSPEEWALLDRPVPSPEVMAVFQKYWYAFIAEERADPTIRIGTEIWRLKIDNVLHISETKRLRNLVRALALLVSACMVVVLLVAKKEYGL